MAENNNPLISIAIATYNGEKYLREQIDSILAQTYKNIEIVVCDDQSSDATPSILDEYAKLGKLRYFINETRLGFVKNFEKAISLCLGEYTALSDQDDIWEQNKLEILSGSIDNNMLIYSNAVLVDNANQPLGRQLLDTNSVNPIGGSNNKAFIFNNCVSGNTLLCRKELLKYALPLPDGIPYHDLWLAFVASTVGSIRFVDLPLVRYRQHENNITDIRKNRKNKKGLKQKLEKKLLSFQIQAKTIKAFAEFEGLTYDDKILLKAICSEYDKRQDAYLNLNLIALLWKHKNELFEINKKISFFNVLKFGYGYKLYKLLPFL